MRSQGMTLPRAGEMTQPRAETIPLPGAETIPFRELTGEIGELLDSPADFAKPRPVPLLSRPLRLVMGILLLRLLD